MLSEIFSPNPSLFLIYSFSRYLFISISNFSKSISGFDSQSFKGKFILNILFISFSINSESQSSINDFSGIDLFKISLITSDLISLIVSLTFSCFNKSNRCSKITFR